MTVARDFTPLPALVTDGAYAFDFPICGASENDPIDQTGFDFRVTFKPARVASPPTADVHEFDVASGKVIVSASVVSLGLLSADVDDWTPGNYVIELRRVNGPSFDPLYVGTVQVLAGVSQGGSALPPVQPIYRAILTTSGAVKILQGPSAGLLAQIQAAAAPVAGAVADAEAARDLAQDYAQNQPTGGSAKDWAQKVGGFVTASLLSAQEWAVGTFKRGIAGFGSAKDWATLLGATVDDAGYSAKEHAVGSTTPTGSAKDWATKTAAEVITGQGFGAKKYANDAATQAGAASGAAGTASGAASAAVAALAAINTPIAVTATGTSAAKTWEGLNSSGGSITRSVPAAPSLYDWVRFSDTARACTANPVTIDGNGHTIEGDATLVLDVDGDDYALMWTGATWTIL